jgi:hypothetical protein
LADKLGTVLAAIGAAHLGYSLVDKKVADKAACWVPRMGETSVMSMAGTMDVK